MKVKTQLTKTCGAKIVLTRKFITVNVYIKKRRKILNQ